MQAIGNARNARGTKRPWFLLLCLIVLSSCAPSAGIFAGGDWQASGLQHQHIRTLAVDLNNPQKIYAGDAQNGIFMSVDGAQHWMQYNTGLPLPTTINALAFDASGKKLYSVTTAGIFVSADSTQRWSKINTSGIVHSTNDIFTTIAFDLKAPHTIYAGTAHNGVFLSANDGKTWSQAGSGLPANDAINSLTFDSDQHQLWGSTDLGVYRSDDGGVTWHAFNKGLLVDTPVYSVQPAFSSGGPQGLIYAGTKHGFFLSNDSGAHWTESKESLAGINIYSVLIDFRQTQASTVFIATNLGVFRSDDKGQSWRTAASGLPRGEHVYALALGSVNYAQLYAAVNDVYIFPGSSGGFSLTRLIPILLILLFFFLLYRLASRGRKRSKEMLKSERIIESPSKE